MVQYEFLMGSCSDLEREKPWCNCSFQPGIPEPEITLLESDAGLVIPSGLKDFYQFSYGATLCMYKILTIEEMIAFRNELKNVYADYRRVSLLPFAYLIDVGDYVAFDVSLQRNGKTLIIDGFHELSPDDWQPICYGFDNWLKRLASNGFEPFWLGDKG